MESSKRSPGAFARLSAGGDPAGVGDPLSTVGSDRRRLDMALTTARESGAARASRGIPGLRNELFPAAEWRRQLESLVSASQDEERQRVAQEEARVTFALAQERADDILQKARRRARRLVDTAGVVARARREQAEREATAALTRARQVAGDTLEAAEREAADIAAHPDAGLQELNERLLRLRSALQDAETRLRAFSSHARRSAAAEVGVIDLDVEQERGDVEATLEVAHVPAGAAVADPGGLPDHVHYVPGPPTYEEGESPTDALHLRPKGRFIVPGRTPDRIEAYRDELTT